MKKLVICFLVLSCSVCALTSAAASVLVYYSFDDEAGFTPAPALVSADLLAASSWQTTASSLRNFGGEAGQAVAHGGDNTFSFSLELAEGMALQLDSLSFWARRSSTGSPDWIFSVNGQQLAAASDMPDLATGVNFNDLTLAPELTEPLSGEIWFTLETIGAEAGTGIFRVDNFTLRGGVSPIPEPRFYATVLGLVAVAGVMLRRRACAQSRISKSL